MIFLQAMVKFIFQKDITSFASNLGFLKGVINCFYCGISDKIFVFIRMINGIKFSN